MADGAGLGGPAEALPLLSRYRVDAGGVAGLYYVPGFVDEATASQLLTRVYAAPKPKWTSLSNRRLQNWGGLPDPRGMVAEPLPPWLAAQAARISELGVYGNGRSANHVLVNEYLPGQGIMPHEDGPLFHPVVATITLGSHGMLDFYPPAPGAGDEAETTVAALEGGESPSRERQFSLLLQPRSLVVVSGDAYRMLHGIAERREDGPLDASVANLAAAEGASAGDTLERGTRVSLTIRNVPKARSISKLFGARKR